jgi:hypothetical protein
VVSQRGSDVFVACQPEAARARWDRWLPDRSRELDDPDIADDEETQLIRDRRVADAGSETTRLPLPGGDGNEMVPGEIRSATSSATPEVIGVCVCGGGIRSVAFALGVLSQLDWGPESLNPWQKKKQIIPRRESVLGRATYLAAVSGGAWAATAWTQPSTP